MTDPLSPTVAQLLAPHCGCEDCRSAVSPGAYLATLLDYVLKHVRDGSEPLTAAYIAERFHQPIGDLPLDCAATETSVPQVRIAVEVLRGYVGVRPLLGAGRETSLGAGEEAYLLAAYGALLANAGTNFEEVRRARSAPDETRAALASRLGVSLTPPPAGAARADELDRMFLDPEALAGDPLVLSEEALERVFGLMATTGDPLSEGLKFGDVAGQLVHWNFDGADPGRNTDAEGAIYASVARDGPAYVVSAYADTARTHLVAAGARSTPTGPVQLTPRDGSNLSGVVGLAYTADAADTSLAVAPLLLGWRLATLRARWFAEDWPDNPAVPAAGDEPPAALVDPQTIGLADLRSTRPGVPAYDVWLARVKELADRRAGLVAARDGAANPAASLDAVIALALSVPGDAVTSARLTDLDAAERKGERIQARLVPLGLTAAAFRFLLPIVALAGAGEAIIAPEWEMVFDTLIVARKRRDAEIWRTAEKMAGITLSPDHFRLATVETAPGPARRLDIAMWLSMREPRRTWSEVLQARVDQEANVGAGVSSARNATEETALPLLRDALIQASDAEGGDLAARAEWLTRRLMVDMRMAGTQRTTRVAQAMETLQEVMFRLRTGQLAIDNPDPWNALASVRAAATPDGRTHLLGRDGEGVLWQRVWDGRWRSWRSRGPLPGALAGVIAPSDLALTVRGAGLDLAVIGTDRTLWVRRFDADWADWEKVPGGQKLTGSPALASSSPAVLDAYVLRIGDLEVLRYRWDGAAWAGPDDTGAPSHRVPAAASRAADSVDLILGRPAAALFAPLHRSWDGAAWQDENLDGQLGGDPVLIAPGADRLELFQNRGGHLYRKVLDGVWQPWEDLDPGLAAGDPQIQGAPTVSTPAPGIIDVYASRSGPTGTRVWFRQFAAGAWSGWTVLPNEDLRLDAPQFDAEWSWVGSHPTLRSATFVRLYPENLLLPSLAPRRTPAFNALLTQTRPGQRITASKACALAGRYADYLQDVSRLQLQATCHVVAAVASADPCKGAAPTQRALKLMFGRAPSGRVYWSAFDPAAQETGYAHSFWDAVPLGGGDGSAAASNVTRIVGALPWISTKLRQHYVYLFIETEEPTGPRLKRTRLNLDRYGDDDAWAGDAEDVELPPGYNGATIGLNAMTVVPVPSDNNAEAPRLGFHVPSTATAYIRHLNPSDSAFAPGEWANFIITPRYLDAIGNGLPEAVRVLLAAVRTGGQNWLVYWNGKTVQAYGQKSAWAISVADSQQHFHGALIGGSSTIFVFSEQDGQNVYRSATSNTAGAPTLGTFYASPDITSVVPHSDVSANFFVSPGTLAHTYARLCRVQGDELSSTSKFDIVPVLGLFPTVPTGLTVTENQNRRLAIRTVYQNNAAGSETILTYLREQFRLVQQQLGLALQASGEYVAALDRFAAVYDYRAPLSKRYIDHGLALDAELPATSVVRFPEGWLLDPLNPHAIARSRRGASARYAIACLMRCLNEFADAQFTIDTNETLPIARLLYDTVLTLADVPEFKQTLPDCGALIGVLDIEPGTFVPPDVAAALGAILEDLTQGAAFPPGGGTVFLETKNLEQLVTAAAKGMIGWGTVLPQLLVFRDEAQAAARPAPTALGAVARSLDTRAAVHAALLADAGVERTVRLAGSLGASAGLPVELAPGGSQ